MTNVALATAEAFFAPSIEFAKRKAKLLRRHLDQAGAQFPLSTMQQAIARVYRAADWFDLEQRYKRGGHKPSPLDDDLTAAQVAARIAWHSECLSQLLQLPRETALAAAKQVRLTASAAVGVESPQRRVIEGQVKGADPGSGDFLFTVRPTCRGIVDGDMVHVDYAEENGLAGVAPMHIATGGFESGDRVYSRAFEQAPTLEQIAEVLLGIKDVLGDRLDSVVAPAADAKRYPLAAAAKVAGVRLVHNQKGRAAARMVEHYETIMLSLSSKSDELFETYPTYQELDSLHPGRGHVAVTVRQFTDENHPLWLSIIVCAQNMAAEVCRRRGRDPAEGKKLKKGSPRNARMNSHLGPAPAQAPIDLALAATSFHDRSSHTEGVEFLAKLLQKTLNARPHEVPKALEELAEEMGFATMINLRKELGIGMWGNWWPADDLRDHLGKASPEAALVKNAMGQYLSVPRTIPEWGTSFQMFSLVAKQSVGDSLLHGIPAHDKVQTELRKALGAGLGQVLLNPYFEGDYYQTPEWQAHMARVAYEIRHAQAYGYFRAGQGPVARASLTRKKQDTLTPNRELHLAGVLLSDARRGSGHVRIPQWSSREQLTDALLAATAVVNAKLRRWRMSTVIEFTDIRLYDRTCRAGKSLVMELSTSQRVH